MSTQQQALLIPSPKAPFVLGQRPIPVPGKGAVRSKVMAVGLNPMNWAQREFDLFITAYPAVIGGDIVGVVDELGEGVDGFTKGDKMLVLLLFKCAVAWKLAYKSDSCKPSKVASSNMSPSPPSCSSVYVT
ncbi:chaperonin 10-like protein [Mycena polygramma]|nr:chaperonin 10-like protein [Mycena polygramma]